MQNDVLATGIMSFLMHELVYFGRSLPWVIIDAIPYFNKYKIQNVCSHSIHSTLNTLEWLTIPCGTAKDTDGPRTVEMRQIGAPKPLHR
jgi:hypothetical protein